MAVEFKSQVGPSFGNNFNNRVEEAVGSAEDIWRAFHEGRFALQPPPFVGYFFLLEDCPKVHEPIAFSEPHFSVDPALRGVSYAKRYEVFLERLRMEKKYSATCLTLATNGLPPEVSFPSPALNFQQFAKAACDYIESYLDSST